jgi:glutamate racemase
VGVIGTIGTIGSGAYDLAVSRASLGAPVKLVGAACPGFVEFVERGRTSGPEVTLLAQRMLAPIVEANVDALLLGCTHYPYLARVISDVVGLDVTLVSSADETAFALRDQLEHQQMLRKDSDHSGHSGHSGQHTFMSSGDVSWFKSLGTRLLGPELSNVDIWNKGN